MIKKSYLILMLAISMLLVSAVPALAVEDTSSVTFDMAASVGFAVGDMALGTINYSTNAIVSEEGTLSVTIEGTLNSASVYASGTLPTGWTLIGTEPTTSDPDKVAIEIGKNTPTIYSPVSILSTDPTVATEYLGGSSLPIKVVLSPQDSGGIGATTIMLNWEATF